MKDYPNILVIRGEGRNVGKTLLACNLISKFSRSQDITALKISYHMHSNLGEAKKLYASGDTILYQETDPCSGKDTGRMLAAGAVNAYLLQTTDLEIDKAINDFLSFVGTDTPILCESGKILAKSNVGVSLFVRQLNCQVCEIEKKIPNSFKDRIVNYTRNGFDINLNSIAVNMNGWTINE